MQRCVFDWGVGLCRLDNGFFNFFWKRYRNKIALRVQVILSGFIYNAYLMMFLRIRIGNGLVDFSPFQGRKVIIVPQAYH